jgi:hypothetical protein
MDIERRTIYEHREPKLSVNGSTLIGATTMEICVDDRGQMLLIHKEEDNDLDGPSIDVISLTPEMMDVIVQYRKGMTDANSK